MIRWARTSRDDPNGGGRLEIQAGNACRLNGMERVAADICGTSRLRNEIPGKK